MWMWMFSLFAFLWRTQLRTRTLMTDGYPNCNATGLPRWATTSQEWINAQILARTRQWYWWERKKIWENQKKGERETDNIFLTRRGRSSRPKLKHKVERKDFGVGMANCSFFPACSLSWMLGHHTERHQGIFCCSDLLFTVILPCLSIRPFSIQQSESYRSISQEREEEAPPVGPSVVYCFNRSWVLKNNTTFLFVDKLYPFLALFCPHKCSASRKGGRALVVVPRQQPRMKSSLNRKLQKLLELDTERPELLSSLEEISSWYGPNTKETRRNLRSEIERRNLLINKEFLEAFAQVQKVWTCSFLGG